MQTLRVECILSCNHPIFQGMPFHVKIDSDLHHGQTAQSEAFGIVLQVNLLHGGLGRLVQFQFHDVERGGRAHHHVYPPTRGTYFHIHIDAQETENDVEHLLVVAFVVRMVAIRHGGKESLEELQHAFHVSFHQGAGQIDDCGRGRQRVGCDIIGQEATHQSYAHFLIGNVEPVDTEVRIRVLDGDVSALVEQGSDACHALCGGIELFRHGLIASNLGGQHAIFP